MPKNNKNHLVRLLAAAGFVIASGLALFVVAPNVQAAACAAPPTDLGTDTLTINVPAAATYTIWTRMKAPDATHNAINLEVDGSSCFNVGGGSFVATSWASGSGNWIKYQNGSTSNNISMALSAGNHTFKYIGTQAGVEIDRIILTSDTSCTPTGTGDNCQSGDSTNPTVALQAPTNGSTVTGNVNLQATASDASGVAKVEFLVDGNAVNTDTASPYEFSWSSTSVSNGSHTIAARATDTKDNVATSSSVTVTVSNGGSGGDTTPPTVPGNLRSTLTTATSVALAWNASTDSGGMKDYIVYRNGAQVGTSTTTSFTDNTLSPSTTYSYFIKARDQSNNTSAASSTISATTLAGSGANKGDLNGNGKVDLTDLSLLLAHWNQTGVPITQGDVNGNGKVDLTDLSILLANWNKNV